MGAKVQGHPARNRPHEGSSKRQSSSLHGRPGATNRVSIQLRGAALPSSGKVQNAADRDVRRNKRPLDRLNTYKNQMELHGCQDPVRCRAFAITLKGPALAWFKTSAVIHLIVHRTFHRICLPLHRNKDVQEAELSPSDYKKELSRKPEVICSKVKHGVAKGRYSRREVRRYYFHCRARDAIERPNVLYLKEPSGKHGRGPRQNREVY